MDVPSNLFTCCRCGAEQLAPVERDGAPVNWARVSYRRDPHASLLTHACPECSGEILAFLEKTRARDVDRAFDHGGEA